MRLKVGVPDAVLAWLRVEAARRGCSVAQVVRDAVETAARVGRKVGGDPAGGGGAK